MTKYALTWSDFERDVRLLSDRLRAHGPFEALVAVSRGGLVPAAMVAHHLDVRLVETVCIASYDGALRQDLMVLKAPSEDFFASHPCGRGVLIVDDLVDGGGTAQALKKLLPEAFLAVVYAKPQGVVFVDAFAKAFVQDVWLVFPWETGSV